MKNMLGGNLSSIESFLTKNQYLGEAFNTFSNILIDGDIISFSEDNIIKVSKKIDADKLLNQISEVIVYGKCFTSGDTVYNPLFANKKFNSKKWKNKYTDIFFPNFESLFFVSILETGNLATFIDFMRIYKELYMESVDEDQETPIENRLDLMSGSFYDRLKQDTIIKYPDGSKIPNSLLRFKKSFANTSYPLNEFTAEMIYNTGFRYYCKCLRDLSLLLKMIKENKSTVHFNLHDYINKNIISDTVNFKIITKKLNTKDKYILLRDSRDTKSTKYIFSDDFISELIDKLVNSKNSTTIIYK